MANSHSNNTSSSAKRWSVCWLVFSYDKVSFLSHLVENALEFYFERKKTTADGSSYLTVKAVIKDASRKTILALSSIHHISRYQLSQESQVHLITMSGAVLTYR